MAKKATGIFPHIEEELRLIQMNLNASYSIAMKKLANLQEMCMTIIELNKEAEEAEQCH